MNLSVTNSPFNEEQATQLNQIIQNLTPEQQTWLSGYLTANQQAVANGSAPTPQVAEYVLNNEPQANSDRHITCAFPVSEPYKIVICRSLFAWGSLFRTYSATCGVGAEPFATAC